MNGDGFADVAVGAPYYGSNRGAAYVYPGGGGSGRLAAVAQVRANKLPVQPWGTYPSLDVRIQGTDPMGRGRVKLQVEACPPGAPFGNAACRSHTSASWTDVTTTSVGAFLIEFVHGLTPRTLYRWRARVLHAPYQVTAVGITPPPNPAHGPWRRFLGQALEADLRTGLGVFLPVVLRD